VWVPSHKLVAKRRTPGFEFPDKPNPCHFVDKAAMNEKNFPKMGKIQQKNKAGSIDQAEDVMGTEKNVAPVNQA
jgi:hypothetical protein